MADITIYLIKRCSMRPSIEQVMEQSLRGFFESVRRINPDWERDYNIIVRKQSNCPETVTNFDVVVYLVQEAVNSVFSRFGAQHTTGHGGLTVNNLPGRMTACEVYVRTDPGTLLARVIFHEILHNKTGWGNTRLHEHHHGGISSASIRVDTPVTDADLDLMGNNLGNPHRQWIGGCSQPAAQED